MSDRLAKLKQQAWHSYQSGELAKAGELCREICASGRADDSIWCLQAAIHGQLRQYAEAKHCAEQAIRIAATNDTAYNLLGDVLVALKEPGKAIDAYLRAIHINPENTCVRCSLCKVLVFRRELDMARKVVSEVLAYQPEHPEANYYVAMLDGRLGRPDLAKARLMQLLRQQLPPRERILVLHEMGMLLESSGDYVESFDYYKKAQDFFSAEYSRKSGDGAIFDSIYRQRGALTSNSCSTWMRVQPDSRRPDPIFLIGFPRSGTTLLEQILSSHSSIAATDEANLLNMVIDAMPVPLVNSANYPYNLHLLRQRDISVLRSCYWKNAGNYIAAKQGAGYLLDKLPLNIIHIPLINRLFPKARIIFALRDPRDVCLSCYTTIFDANPAMNNFSDMEKTAKLYTAIMDLWEYYQDRLAIDKTVVRYEELIINPDTVTNDLIQFLGLPWEASMLEFYAEKNKRYVTTPSFEGVFKPIHGRSIGRWKKYAQFLPQMLQLLEPYVQRFGYD